MNVLFLNGIVRKHKAATPNVESQIIVTLCRQAFGVAIIFALLWIVLFVTITCQELVGKVFTVEPEAKLLIEIRVFGNSRGKHLFSSIALTH